jgi:putative ABC transport system permease protein
MRLEATRYSIAERVRGYGFDTALASAAIAVATFTMVFLVSLVGSAFEMMTTGLRRVGSDLLFVTEDMSARTLRQLPRRLTLADAEALSKLPVGISEVGASLGMFAMASGCGQSQVIRLLGVTETQRELEGWVVAEGRFVSVTDVRQRQAVAVLGASVLKRPGCAADERSYVRIGSHQLRVTGRLASRGKVFGANLDDIVLMPITSMTSKFGREDMNVDLTIKLEPGAVASAVSAQVRALLRYRHRLRPGDPDRHLDTIVG